MNPGLRWLLPLTMASLLSSAWGGDYFGRQKVVYHSNYDDLVA